MELLPIIFIAFIIAVLFSMLGLGGAIIYTPLFYWLGLPILTAIPMALLLNVITTASASMTYLKERLVNKNLALPMIFTSVFGALAGSSLAHKIDTKLIIVLLSIILFIASMRILFFSNICISISAGGKKRILIGAITAFIIGVVSSLAGIGGGTFMVPLLLVLGLETRSAIATSAFIITFMSLSGFLGYLGFSSELDIRLLIYAGIAAFAGAQVGSKIIFRRISSNAINRIFAIILLFVVGKLIYGLV
jgi:uncharacterized membrane protein YfcA